ncbi:MAG: hypothetical protein UY31_C0012G0004 [Candidatus Wolfebacteria bacterium GW2011_GWE1_48_7]|uniref:Uncharacterized protein n=2 Tax=Candidatus Wolfeibacteriota TaxID=1752735 RepID=A0A0G1U896_9BACT|nr:MAG: hypothetical protein UX70_C0001G0531 [Candidatus Wolfebacteria bacterium GW2011_GWB1_47_1]KKU34517.1 MAG: hypothetical protein UX49_C0043G0006 [Candidatus Wolfebacteria bacterium GW2011_GWC2_46_275]KKU42531.1 MAG: hypothetical protein UX58_C0002G0245 [Candidatus Wolfebacteria bacterium GW2011_GWB2_46_69]KKU53908.1 MAG: hypothetical protein UX76_C0008G0031 [Candidatus Wolfebacteria bacterium GW2011_GWC1_47_103]KKU66328.1 MAG: hypothetical protein UX90_C0001G0387 [Candidatus Wolfebacteria
MVNQALIDVVKNQLAGGIGEQEIREFLRRRGTSDDEVQEIFKALSVRVPTLSEIPVTESVPALPEQSLPVPAAPEISVAHGIEREIPPLQPSAPFEPLSLEPAPVREDTSSGIVLPPVLSRGKRIIRIGSIIASVVLVLVGGAYAYTVYFASPEQILDRMILQVRDVRAMAFATEINVTASGGSLFATAASSTNPFAGMLMGQEQPTKLTVTSSGAFDFRDEVSPKVSILFEADTDKWPLGDFALGAEYRNLDRKNYVKVNNIPDLGFFSLSFLKNKWFVIEDKEAKTQLGASTGSSETVIPDITQEQRNQLADAWGDHRFLTVNKRLSPEEIDGVAMHHFSLAFDKEKFKEWIIVTDAIMQNEPTDVSEMDETLSFLNVDAMETWIGKRDSLPYKYTAQISLRDKVDASRMTTMNIVLTGKNFGKNQEIIAPDGAQSFEEVLQGIFGQMLGAGAPTSVPATPQARNDQRRKDVTLIADAIKKNVSDNGGTFMCATGPLPQKATFLGAAGFGMSGYAIESCLVPKYLPAMPKDPTKGGLGMSGYSAYYDSVTKRITVRAPYAEEGSKITITK